MLKHEGRRWINNLALSAVELVLRSELYIYMVAYNCLEL